MWELTLSGHEAVGLMELTHLDPALEYTGKEEKQRILQVLFQACG
jgi:hypothetical protein